MNANLSRAPGGSPGRWTRALAAALLCLGPLALGCEDETASAPAKTVHGSGQVVEEQRAVEGFSALEHASLGAVHLSFGETEGLRIVAEDNMIDEIITEVDGNVLRIRTRSGVQLRPTEDIDFHLDAKTLEALTLSGVGEIEGPAFVEDTALLAVTGVGGISLQGVQTQSVRIVVTGVGGVRLSGSTQEAEIDVTGVGDIDLGAFATRIADVNVTGRATLSVRVSETLSFRVTGEGDLCYFGDPQLDVDIAGAGSISRCD